MKCCFCDKEFEGYGNSTHGCWSDEEERAGNGEKLRCCDECNLKVVIPARYRKIMFSEKSDGTVE